jgi:hypothetical protein
VRLARTVTVVLAGILLVSGLACSGSGATTYQLFTDVEGQGTVSPSSGNYASGSVVTITAVPAEGWRLGWWAGDANGHALNISITFDSDKHVFAHFEEGVTAPVPTSIATLTP